MGSAGGQVTILLVAGLFAVLIGTLALGAFARGIGTRDAAQRAADLAALAGARAMQANYARLFELPAVGGRANPRHLESSEYLALARSAAARVAQLNGGAASTAFPDERELAPVRIRVAVDRRFRFAGRSLTLHAHAEAELVPPLGAGFAAHGEGGGYDGPLAHRQGKPMRPDVALAFDRMAAAARAAGVALTITSGFRSDAEQAVLFARHPDPKWVAPPGRSLHRNGTELDLGPQAAHAWLAANARRFHFVQRYAWEPWHFGYVLNPRSAPRVTAARRGVEGDGSRGSLPEFVPSRFAPALNRAAQRWSVSAVLLAAQLYAESNFNPFAISSAGAQGIAQFMPATAHGYGLQNPFDAAAAIDAQAHMMRDLLRRFGSVPLALAAYNAGPGRVAGCGCIPPFPETRGYVARILGLMSGAGESLGATGGGLGIRLVE